MASRMSRGCQRCRARRVKCEEGRPSCRQCLRRNEICEGYRDEASLIFRSENEKVAQRVSLRRSNSESSSQPLSSSLSAKGNDGSPGSVGTNDLSDLSTGSFSNGSISSQSHHANNAFEPSSTFSEEYAVSQFFEKYVMYPCNDGSSPGFLEHLPSLFKDVQPEGRLALRWAVRAASYASLSCEEKNSTLCKKALHCYGMALSGLAESLADPGRTPDDYVLMTVVILDLFESVYLQDSVSVGAHAQGMAQILRLRGPSQVYGARGWSLFRLSQHRLQRQKLAFKQGVSLDSEPWVGSLDGSLPCARVEKDNSQITQICEQARNLLTNIDDPTFSVEQKLEMVKEIHALDQLSLTWRKSAEWAYKTIRRSDLALDEATASTFPEMLQLHRDVWIAYEWNYHRTARIIMHEQLLLCLDSLRETFPESRCVFSTDFASLENASRRIIHGLVDEVLSTVPQSLGDIDHEGNVLSASSGAAKCKGVGSYFMLWPIKITKSTRSASREQRIACQNVFERIREYTGMKSALGDLSSI